MTGLAYAAAGTVLLGCAAIAWGAAPRLRERRQQPPHDRVDLSWRERAKWRAAVRRSGWEVRRQLAIAWAEEMIDRAERRIREHSGEE